MTFDQLANGCTHEERRALAWELGRIRLRKTVEALAEVDCHRCGCPECMSKQAAEEPQP